MYVAVEVRVLNTKCCFAVAFDLLAPSMSVQSTSIVRKDALIAMLKSFFVCVLSTDRDHNLEAKAKWPDSCEPLEILPSIWTSYRMLLCYRYLTFPKSLTSKRSKASNSSLFFMPNKSLQAARKVLMFFRQRN